MNRYHYVITLQYEGQPHTAADYIEAGQGDTRGSLFSEICRRAAWEAGFPCSYAVLFFSLEKNELPPLARTAS